jgi:hypothetical protein
MLRYYATTTSGSILYPARTQKGFVIFCFMTAVRWNLLGKKQNPEARRGKFAKVSTEAMPSDERGRQDKSF